MIAALRKDTWSTHLADQIHCLLNSQQRAEGTRCRAEGRDGERSREEEVSMAGVRGV